MKRASLFVILFGSLMVFVPTTFAQQKDAAGKQPAPQSTPHVYRYPTGSHPPIFVTEIYRHQGHGHRRRELNVFVYGMKPDVWRLLNCYKPCCCVRGGVCCEKHRTAAEPAADDAPPPPAPAER
ncbi:MAG: hypothetical protein VX257_00630 [Planctomycetota bacterium]|nr:hypothetical protein [Planctomycetota bacterium]